VTGASSGIGEATVRLLRKHDWDVVAVARRADRLERLSAETGAQTFVADLTVEAEVASLSDYLGQLGTVHTLINNAGGAIGFGTVEDTSADDWRAMFEINVLAVQRVTSALLPLLRRGAAESGVADVLTVTSIAGHVAYEGGAGYNASKFGSHALMAALRLELAGEPIRVIEIAPGMVRTDEFALVRFKGDESQAAAVYEGVDNPLVAEDVAEVIVHALELPGHVNLDLVTIKPVAQAAPHKVIREPLKPR
jgi:NADP-dependent 3-hydroxy acid dehydrogenase YdfG